MTRWIDMHRKAGDGDIGQTLVRLAGLAAAVHRVQQGKLRTDVDADATEMSRLTLVRTAIDNGPDGAAEGTAIHKEVNR